MTGEDEIQIRDLVVRGIIGTTERERVAPQDIRINIVLYVDLQRAGESDKVEDTVDYSRVITAVMGHVETAKRYTVEALAADISRMCLDFAGVNRVRVRVEKPGLYHFTQAIGVEIERNARA